MSYEDFERSVDEAGPVELYRFVLSAAERHLFTSGDAEITYAGDTYAPVTISRSEIEQTAEIHRGELEVQVSRDNPLVAQFTAAPPDRIVTLTVFRHHRDDSEFITYWKGRLLSVLWAGGQVTLKCEPVFSSLKRAGLRRRYQASCPHVLYGPGCFVTRAAFATEGVVTQLVGARVSADAFGAHPNGWFTGGYLQFGALARRLIMSHINANVTLSAPLPELTVGASVTAYAGCDHALSTCDTKFDNAANNGGFPFAPQRNPFQGSIT